MITPLKILLLVIPRQRPPAQLHDPEVLPRADQLVRQDLAQQARRGRGQNEQTRERPRKTKIYGFSGKMPFKQYVTLKRR